MLLLEREKLYDFQTVLKSERHLLLQLEQERTVRMHGHLVPAIAFWVRKRSLELIDCFFPFCGSEGSRNVFSVLPRPVTNQDFLKAWLYCWRNILHIEYHSYTVHGHGVAGVCLVNVCV